MWISFTIQIIGEHWLDVPASVGYFIFSTRLQMLFGYWNCSTDNLDNPLSIYHKESKESTTVKLENLYLCINQEVPWNTQQIQVYAVYSLLYVEYDGICCIMFTLWQYLVTLFSMTEIHQEPPYKIISSKYIITIQFSTYFFNVVYPTNILKMDKQSKVHKNIPCYYLRL